jgi:hypothetical protein
LQIHGAGELAPEGSTRGDDAAGLNALRVDAGKMMPLRVIVILDGTMLKFDEEGGYTTRRRGTVKGEVAVRFLGRHGIASHILPLVQLTPGLHMEAGRVTL